MAVLVSEEMIDRAVDVIFAAPGLDYLPTSAAMAHNRQIIARALAAALGGAEDAGPSDEDRIREAMAEAMEHPGREVTR